MGKGVRGGEERGYERYEKGYGEGRKRMVERDRKGYGEGRERVVGRGGKGVGEVGERGMNDETFADIMHLQYNMNKFYLFQT